MQGGGGGRDPFFNFGDPFAGFGGFPGFESHGSLMSSLFGGRNPFDDPFFTRPFGGMFESRLFGPSASMFPSTSMFPSMQPSAFIEHQHPEPKRSRGPIIEELDSEDETDEEKSENPRKHRRSSKEPYVEVPDDGDEVEAKARSSNQLQYRNPYERFNNIEAQPQSQMFAFQSSTVTYGGPNGAYYSSSKMRKTGNDGVTIEESKEADSSTRQATHKISRGLHNKGHSLTRKLKSDGRVDTMQTLHNLDENELAGFEEAWKVKARQHLPGWSESFSGNGSRARISDGQNLGEGQGGWALPSTTEHPQPSERMIPGVQPQPSEGMIPDVATRERAGLSYSQQPVTNGGYPDVGDKSSRSRWRARRLN